MGTGTGKQPVAHSQHRVKLIVECWPLELGLFLIMPLYLVLQSLRAESGEAGQ